MFVYLVHLICFILLVLVALFALVPRFRPLGIDLVAAAVSLIGIAYTVSLAVARVLVLAAVCLSLICCGSLTPQQRTLLSSAASIAGTVGTAVAAYYGGAQAGTMASAGLSAAGQVLQGYVGGSAPTAVIAASPGVRGVADVLINLLPKTGVISQATVNTIHKAAAIAASLTASEVTPAISAAPVSG